ncbi:MAG TPA: PQQ-binding-like beta-propeller repeat protein [Sphingobacteriaceae bacterium]|nr:PQQ-binding-like beta-propeller repeat protein [Sphingobacteriaceae bacterium]
MKKLLVIPMIVCFLGGFAQQTDKPDFTYDMGGKINFMQLSDAGVLVVAGNGGLAGINPHADAPHFVFKEYGRVKAEEIDFVPYSPYLVVSQGGLTSSKKSVIDIITGKTLFATEENGWRNISELQVFLPQNKLVVVGNRSNKERNVLAVGVYDLESGQQEVLASLDPNVGKVRSGNAVPLSSGRPFLTVNSILVPTTKKLVSVDLNSGEIRWEADVDKIAWMYADALGNEIYTFEERSNGDTRIQKVSSDGKVLWDKERKIKGKVSKFEILPQGLAVVSDVDNSGKSGIARFTAGRSESKIAFLNAANGEDLWEKAPQTKGYVQHFYVMDDGILFGIYSGGINKISFDGNTLFKKPLSTGENIHTMASTPRGLIYITDTDAGIVNLSTGEPIWDKPIKYKKAKAVASAYDEGNKRYLLSTGDEIVAIDEDSGNITTLADIDFKEKEAPTSLIVRDDGLLLSSSQNLSLFEFDGKKKYHTYHKSPGQSGFVKVASGVLAVASVAVAASAAFQGGMYGTYPNSSMLNSYGNQMKIVQDGFSDIATVSFQTMNKRFRATAATENAQFILTSLNSGVGLVKVNKSTGEVDKEILLKDRKPVYEVDELGGILYYKAKDSQIVAFVL